MELWLWVGAGVLYGIGIVVAVRRARRRARSVDPWVLRYSLPILLAGLAVAVGAFFVAYSAVDGQDSDRFDAAIKAATAAGAITAGLLTWSRLELSSNEHRLGVNRDLTERYGRAVEQLGSDRELVRTGGVYALERFALDAVRVDPASDVDWRIALDILGDLVRDESDRVRRESADGSALIAAKPAVAAVRVLGRFPSRANLHDNPVLLPIWHMPF